MAGTLALSRAHFPVTSLGYGRRTGIWFQGCAIKCAGCIVPETWRATAEHEITIEQLLLALKPWLSQSDGVTISGGEPFMQPAALACLLAELRRRCDGDLLVYSGFTTAYLRKRFPAILSQCDVLITGPFREDLPDGRPFIGSSNQELLLNTELGRVRYGNLEQYERRRDVAIGEGVVYMAGVPRRGELDSLVTALTTAGYEAAATNNGL